MMEETEELLDDLWTAHTGDELPVTRKDPYFLGSIVLIKEEHQPTAEVIDGQQRLTTLTILMLVLRGYLQPKGADAISDYLRQKGKMFEGMKDEFRVLPAPSGCRILRKTHPAGGRLERAGQAESRRSGGNDAQRNIRANALYLAGKLKTRQAQQLAAFTQFIITKCLMVGGLHARHGNPPTVSFP